MNCDVTRCLTTNDLIVLAADAHSLPYQSIFIYHRRDARCLIIMMCLFVWTFCGVFDVLS